MAGQRELVHMEIVSYSGDEGQSPEYTSDDLPSSDADTAANNTNNNGLKRKGGAGADQDDGNRPKRQRHYFELEMPVTEPGQEPPIHNPELYEEIQRMAERDGVEINHGTTVVLKCEPGEGGGSKMVAEALVADQALPCDGGGEVEGGMGWRGDVEQVNKGREAEKDEQVGDDSVESTPRPPVSPLTPNGECEQELRDDVDENRGLHILLEGIELAQERDLEHSRLEEELQRSIAAQGEHSIKNPNEEGHNETRGARDPQSTIEIAEEAVRRLSDTLLIQHDQRISYSSSVSLISTEAQSPSRQPSGKSGTVADEPCSPIEQRWQPGVQERPIINAATNGQNDDSELRQPRTNRGFDYDSDELTGREQSSPSPPRPISPIHGLKRIGKNSLLAAFPRVPRFRRMRTWAGRQSLRPDIRRLHTALTLLPYPCVTRPGRRNIIIPPRPPPSILAESPAEEPPPARTNVYPTLPNRDVPIPSIEVAENYLIPAPTGTAGHSDAPRRRARIRIGPPRGRGNRPLGAATTQTRVPAADTAVPLQTIIENVGDLPEARSEVKPETQSVHGEFPAVPAANHSITSTADRGAPRRRANTRRGPPPGRKPKPPNTALAAEAPSTVAAPAVDLPAGDINGQPRTEGAEPKAMTPANTAAKRVGEPSGPPQSTLSAGPSQGQEGLHNGTAPPIIQEPNTTAAPKKGRRAPKTVATAPTRITRAAARAAAAAEAAANAPMKIAQAERPEESSVQDAGSEPKAKAAKAAPKKTMAAAPKAKTTAKNARGAKAKGEEANGTEGEGESGEAVPKGGVAKSNKGTKVSSKTSGKGCKAPPKKDGKKK
ncbi:hypothetical protein LOZ04_000269 [Ophidiomyces ophidiicola]|nr:hypothetical protein LOZ04_000269 [Ophidiomyces ophidiicola]